MGFCRLLVTSNFGGGKKMTYFRAGLILFVAVSAATAQAQSIGFSISDTSSNAASDQIQVTVIDDVTQTPITGAQVTINDSIGFRSVTDRMKSDPAGTVSFRGLSPSPKTVTVSKSGYATLSVVGVQGSAMTAYLRPVIAQAQTVISSGTINNWDGASDDSSMAHGGLVFRTMGALDLLNFQISNFISPLKDTLDLGGLAGKHNIPSNIAIPEQSVSYLFINIDLNKPTFRLPIPASQQVGLTGVEIEASVSDLVSIAQSKQFSYDILNKVKFLRVGMTQNFSSDRDVQVNIDATMPLVQQHQVSITAQPPFQADVVAASLTDAAGDKSVLIPSDVKTILNSQNQDGPQTVALSAPQGASPESLDVATIAIAGKGTQISGVLVSSAPSTVQTGEFLNTDALAQGQAIPANVQVTSPAQGVGAAIFETDQPVWYVYTLPVAGSVSVPTGKITASQKLVSYSINQIEFSQFDANSVDGTKIMSKLQRFARSSAKLGSRRR